jgi:phosphoserine phosphatase RsbU/P
LARIDPRTRELVYASAGQRGYLLHANRRVTILDSTSLPLGVEAEAVIPSTPSVVMQPGDILTFFTDGVVEAESPGRVRFGVGRALEAIRGECDKPARQIIDALHAEIDGFTRHQPQRDDITVVIVKVTG